MRVKTDQRLTNQPHLQQPPPPTHSGGLAGTVTNAFRRFWGGNNNAEAKATPTVYFENIELE